jgi:tetratricopeptide (TPR) repeat protein
MIWGWTLVLACADLSAPAPLPPPAPVVAAAAPEAATTTADELLAELDGELAGRERLAAEHPDDWTRQELVSGLRSERARLTGSWDDWSRADAALTQAFAIAPAGSGPWLSKARLDFALHRNDQVEASLQAFEKRVLIDVPQRAELARIRGDLALQDGRHDDARAFYLASITLRDTMPAQYGLAQLAWREGRFDEAMAALDTIESDLKVAEPKLRAWLDLQRGLVCLDQGRFAEAERHYDAASAHLPGWYLVDEHKAEIAALQGRIDEAEGRYRDVIARTGGAEFMDALAGLLQERGAHAEAAALAAQAEAEWRRILVQHPSAAGGHALDHFLDFPGDPQETVALAERNARLRPNGESKVKLARALLAAGRADDARRAVDEVLAGPYRSAELFVTSAEVWRALGDAQRAEADHARARAIDPSA